MAIVIRPLEFVHWEAIRRIYLEGIATGQATFETRAPTWAEWDGKQLPTARIAAMTQAEQRMVGWGALSPVSFRPVYSGVAEVSVYVSEEARGKRIGKKLLQRLIEESEINGIWTLQANIFPENLASVNLHHSCGFRPVGHRERIAKLHGVWRDTLLMERRSKVTGND